jgi:hypothetical protein
MTRLEAFAKFVDGRGRVVHVERDDAVGRREMDKVAHEWLAKDTVASVQVTRTTRVARGKRGTHR